MWCQLSFLINYMMIEESICQVLMQDQISTVGHHTIMTEQFINVYKEALEFSNLNIGTHLKYRNVSIFQKQHIHEVYTVGNNQKPHLVLLHGYGGTSLTFIRMFKHLNEHFQVHALDTFGIGLSSRGNWNNDMIAAEAITYYVQAIEQWRKKLGLNAFILAGHSFGGYISTLYMQKYPQRVKQLILLSPAGTATHTDESIKQRASKSRFFFCIAEKVYGLNIRPSRVMNAFWIGNKFIDRILNNRLKLPENEQVVWKKYLKFICQQEESSEQGFYKLFEWPLQPIRSIEAILTQIKPTIQIDFLYGDQDWMQPEGAHRLTKEFKKIKVHTIEKAGHQLLFDNPQMVSDIMIKAI